MKAVKFSKPLMKALRIALLLAILLTSMGNNIQIAHAACTDDTFDCPTVIGSLPFSISAFDTTNYHFEIDEHNLGDFPGKCEGKDLRKGLATVWYSYNPGASSVPVFLDTIGSTTNIPNPNDPPLCGTAGHPSCNPYQYDTILAVFTGTTLNNLTLVVCNDNPENSTNQAQLAFYALPNTTYYIQVSEYNGVLNDGNPNPGYIGGSLNFHMTTGLTISGNVGINGGRLTYAGGATTADSNGNYTLAIPSGFSSTVTPSLPTGATFTPANKSYISVMSNLTGQNYTAKRTFPSLNLWTGDFSYYPQGWRVELHPRVMGDVNGDGKDDAVGFGYGGVLVGLSTGTSFAPATRWTEDFSYNQGWRTDLYPRMLGDVNGDGKDDVVGFGYAGAVVALSNGTNGFNPLSLWTSDFSYYPQGWRADLHPRVMADVNGDGKDDIVGFGYSGAVVALSTGSSFAPLNLWTGDFSYYPQGWRVELHPRELGDVNGDGKADIVGFGYGGVLIALSTGTGFAPASLVTTNFSYNQGWRVELYPRMVGDANGDGLDDLIGFGYSGVVVGK